MPEPFADPPDQAANSPPAAGTEPAVPIHLREPHDSGRTPTAPEGDPSGAVAGGLPARVGRYEVLEEIAHGGMGAVFKVRDHDLGRTLAMKVLRDCHQERPDLHRRFLEEAQIGGQLQHPGLVPVHELGRLPDQRPFFTMKLVKGRTLAELLRDRPQDTDARDLPRLLAIFEQVCQTLAYVHSRGVIHRDLKPANVMVGSFGEVQVMDWGLAKLVGQEPAAPVPPDNSGGSTFFTTRTTDADAATQAGTVLGTPAYMPPEQVRGQVDHLDERCDVFGLGALLCEILTGAPPYRGPSDQALQLAARGDLADARARLERCGADDELWRLALQCLAFQPLERPAHAGVVAEAVTAYRAGVAERARRAELARAEAQTKAIEERKRRRLLVCLAPVVLLALAGGGGAWLWQERKRLELEHEAEASLDKAALLQGEGKLPEALAQAQHAQALLPAVGDRPDLRRRIDDRLAEIELMQELRRIRTPATDSPSRVNTRYRADAEYGKAFRAFGIDVDALEPAEAAARINARAALKPALIAALDDWVVPRQQARPNDPASWRHLLAVARAADPDPWRDRLRGAVAGEDVATLQQLATAPDLAAPLSTLHLLAESLLRAGQTEAMIALLRRVQWHHPGDFWTNYKLGLHIAWYYANPAHVEEVLRYYAIAVALRPDSGIAWNDFGLALGNANRLDDALAAEERAIQLLPDHPLPHVNLAMYLNARGDAPGARRAVNRALECSRKAVAADPSDAVAWNARGLALHGMGDFAGASGAYRAAIRGEPSYPDPYINLTEALHAQGLLDEAVAAARQGGRAAVGRDVAFLNEMTFILLEKGDSLEEAESAIVKAGAIDPGSDLAALTLAELRRAQGRFAESLDAYRKGDQIHAAAPRKRWPTATWVKDAEHLVELDGRWPAIEKGEQKPEGAAEHVEYAQLCVCKRLYATAADFYKRAFVLDPKFADDLGADHRYKAARAAALAGGGHDIGKDRLGDAGRARWREQARNWLAADLALLKQQAATGTMADRVKIRYALNHWRTHNHLAAIRDADAVARLPEDEAAACRKLWEEVAALHKELEPAATGTPPDKPIPPVSK